MKTKTGKKILALTFALFMISSNSFSRLVVSRTVSECGKREMCANTSRMLCDFIDTDGSTKTGVCIECSGGGNTKCPTKEAWEAGMDIDQVDLNQSELLFEYAISQIDYNVLSGSHQINVQVTGEPNLRIYRVTWNWEDDSIIDTGTMFVERLD